MIQIDSREHQKLLMALRKHLMQQEKNGSCQSFTSEIT